MNFIVQAYFYTCPKLLLGEQKFDIFPFLFLDESFRVTHVVPVLCSISQTADMQMDPNRE